MSIHDGHQFQQREVMRESSQPMYHTRNALDRPNGMQVPPGQRYAQATAPPTGQQSTGYVYGTTFPHPQPPPPPQGLSYADREWPSENIPPINRAAQDSEAPTQHAPAPSSSHETPAPTSNTRQPDPQPGRRRKAAEDANSAPKRKRGQGGGKRNTEASETKPRATGKGSKTQLKRDPGASEDEIELLTPEDIKAAGLAPHGGRGRGLDYKQKLMAVKYVVNNWPRYKYAKSDIMKEIADLTDGDVTNQQVSSYWNTVYDKYKQVQDLDKHTGEEDGDNDRMEVLSEGEDCEKKVVPGKTKYRKSHLEAFRETKVYKLIDEVASTDPDIRRARKFNSAAPISDDEPADIDITDDESSDEAPAKKRIKSETKPLVIKSKGKVPVPDGDDPVDKVLAYMAKKDDEKLRAERARDARDEQRLQFEKEQHEAKMRMLEAELADRQAEQRLKNLKLIQELAQSPVDDLRAQAHEMFGLVVPKRTG
ncbi:hypothetical protein GGG16DRAFT_102974 [Schizophyllum commune]